MGKTGVGRKTSTNRVRELVVERIAGGVLFEDFQVDEFERGYVRGTQIYQRGMTGLISLLPTQYTQTPTVTIFEAWEIVEHVWGRKVVPLLLRESQEILSRFHAYRVHPIIAGTRIAAPIAVEPSHGVRTARFEIRSQHVLGHFYSA